MRTEPATSERHATVFTLFEGDYYLGVGALINSLYAGGFRGVFYAAYRGELCGWATSSVKRGDWLELEAAEGLTVRLIQLEPGWHLANLKPSFMLRVLNEFEPRASSVFYFDPDITVKCRWSFFEEWVEAGAAMVCEPYMTPMPASHPFRFYWMQVLGKVHFVQKRTVEFYVNSGFLGIKREDAAFVEEWHSIIEAAGKLGHDLGKYKTHDQTDPFNSCDQDWLNCAIMTCDTPISVIGPEGMDLKPGGFVMAHAIETIKPWRKGMGRQVLRGFTPTQPMRNYWNHTQYPLRLYSPLHAKFKRFNIGIAVFIGRFYRKG